MSLFINENESIKILSYNIVSLRAILIKGNLIDLIKNENPDIFFFQEVKAKDNVFNKFVADMIHLGYTTYDYNKGEFGTCFFSKIKPLSWKTISPFDQGRIITVSFKDVNIIAVYAQNAGEGLKFMKKKIKWTQMIDALLMSTKDVLLLGDLNVVHQDEDVHFSKDKGKKYQNIPGYTVQERSDFKELVKNHGLIDLFRNKSSKKEYTYYSYKSRANKDYFENVSNRGWRVDYFFLKRKNLNPSNFTVNHIKHKGSDHMPLTLTYENDNEFIEELGTVTYIETEYIHNDKKYSFRTYKQTGKSEHKPLKKCFDYGYFYNHQFYVAEQTPFKSFMFMSFPDSNHFESYYLEAIKEKQMHLFEVIPQDTKCKLYFDIDSDSKSIFRTAYYEILDYFNIDMEKTFITKSSNGYHIICDKYYDNNEIMKPIVKDFIEKKKVNIDWKVYTKNRLMRLIFSSKIDGDILKPINIKETELKNITFSDYLINQT